MRTKDLYLKHRERIQKTRRDYYWVNRERISARRRELYNAEKQRWVNIEAKYSLTKEQIEEMQKTQGNKCLICNDELTPFRIDHSHATGKVRGLLCHSCNIGLGNFKDDPNRLIAAAIYLKYELGNIPEVTV